MPGLQGHEGGRGEAGRQAHRGDGRTGRGTTVTCEAAAQVALLEVMQMSSSERIRVMVADDHPIMRNGLRDALDAEEDFEVVGQAADGDRLSVWRHASSRCRCGHEWLLRNRSERPRVCPRCKSRNWDKPLRVRLGRGK